MSARLAIAALCLLALAGCGSSASRTAATHRVSRPPKIVQAERMRASPAVFHPLRPGTRVSGSFSGRRFFANSRDGFALGNLTGKEGGAMYPLATRDGGKKWRIAGPLVDVPAANAPVDVAQAGAYSSRLWFMCCGLNTVVDVTSDAGKHWWYAFLPGEVTTVEAGAPSFTGPQARLIAVVRPTEGARGEHQLWIYVSRDGRRWTYDPSLKSIY
jgi:hypothetical protein